LQVLVAVGGCSLRLEVMVAAVGGGCILWCWWLVVFAVAGGCGWCWCLQVWKCLQVVVVFAGVDLAGCRGGFRC
jgi:hypothetical protein